ncbi:mycothiol transferase [Xylanimonas protaetiae]|uniref:DUF664 domain-containing protein n=1 Tax=Xylanimonas protaetiae TaxID=2509457 RepID=A0A4V0YFW6_9MICO|nr:DUF664 domain-containing protein [Xylanimonas protaetiae]QAY69141.1 DUF664 domain-containing protein [Xylanimonas protaetiae]
MNATEILLDSYGRLPRLVHAVVDDADNALLTYRVDPGANTVAWLVWHLTRAMSAQLADVAGTEDVWTAEGWSERFALPFAARATGYGMSADEVGAVRASAELLGGYFDAAHAAGVAYVGSLADGDLDRVVDTRWDPPVTLGVRLVSIVDDCLQHVGQAAYVRGVFLRRAGV